MNRLSPFMAYSVVCISIIIVGIFFGIIPLFSVVAQQRASIDTFRASILSAARQQSDSELSIEQQYNTMKEKQNVINGYFLNNQNVIDFYNTIDDSFNTIGIRIHDTRIDSPSPQDKQQLIGVHFTMKATSSQAVSFVQSFGSMTQPIRVDTIIMSAPIANVLEVSIDGVIPWQPPPTRSSS